MWQPRVGFIGLGVMGGPMARNLASAGFEIRVFDLDESRAQPAIAHGAQWVPSVAQVASQSDVVMTSLPGPVQVQSVGLDDDGVLSNMHEGGIWIELSTNNADVCKQIVARGAACGISVLDSPVSGGDEGADAGSLTVLVGGDESTFQRCRPIYEVIGEHIEYLGPSGAGYSAKIAQVILCYVHSLALSEAMMLGVKGGVDPEKMLGIIQGSTASSYAANRYGPNILDGDYDPSFTLRLALKDLRLAAELADSLDIDLPLCNLTTETYTTACERFGGESNHLKAVRVLEDACGQLLRRR